jgi:hypothetical protein
MDGGGGGLGKRVATTLVYCEAADEGGGTVFPQVSPCSARTQQWAVPLQNAQWV